jgi:hypothetical protein
MILAEIDLTATKILTPNSGVREAGFVLSHISVGWAWPWVLVAGCGSAHPRRSRRRAIERNHVCDCILNPRGRLASL